MNVYVATSYDPFYNLAVENWLFREMLTDSAILYLWQNKPCVVIGRAQNPWRECNIDALNEDHIPIIRRQSGGGTVYHDLGNLNYTIMAPANHYDKHANLQLIVSILAAFNVKAYISPRNDIFVHHHNHDYKISGSAFRETKDRSFHHGTLLINTDTSKLYQYLHHKIDDALITKGVYSKRSMVINLKEIDNNICPKRICEAFLTRFNTHITYLPNNLNQMLIAEEMEKLHTWEWRFGKTLPFNHSMTLNGNHFTLEVKNGQLISIKTSDMQSYSNLVTWVSQGKPSYTKQSFKPTSNMDFTAQERLLLQFLYDNIPTVFGSM
ncbi:lipoate--protein ligase [Fastidiosibacter lacustris]|uniref:lipoate--protein ligase n=1 Tax=Fastidiosibacter lacustris TaxID=2056695 RepID=UPI000E3579B7|nr:lipoate--protein ligase [Fastidiosibacter lacustris]